MRIKGHHFIDTCVLLGCLEKRKRFKKKKEICETYLSRMGRVYNGYISVEVVGEFTKVILEKRREDYEDLMRWLRDFILGFDIEIIGNDKETFRKLEELNKGVSDCRIGGIDRVLLSRASTDKRITNFITIERAIKTNKRLSGLLNLKINDPEELIS